MKKKIVITEHLRPARGRIAVSICNIPVNFSSPFNPPGPKHPQSDPWPNASFFLHWIHLEVIKVRTAFSPPDLKLVLGNVVQDQHNTSPPATDNSFSAVREATMLQ